MTTPPDKTELHPRLIDLTPTNTKTARQAGIAKALAKHGIQPPEHDPPEPALAPDAEVIAAAEAALRGTEITQKLAAWALAIAIIGVVLATLALVI